MFPCSIFLFIQSQVASDVVVRPERYKIHLSCLFFSELYNPYRLELSDAEFVETEWM